MKTQNYKAKVLDFEITGYVSLLCVPINNPGYFITKLFPEEVFGDLYLVNIGDYYEVETTESFGNYNVSIIPDPEPKEYYFVKKDPGTPDWFNKIG